MTTTTKYYVFTEGYANWNSWDGKTTYFGKIQLVGLEAFVEEDGSFETGDWLWDEDADSTYITNKWGGEKLINLPDEGFEPEFSNGLCDIGVFDTLEIAQKEYAALIEGEVDYETFSNETAQ